MTCRAGDSGWAGRSGRWEKRLCTPESVSYTHLDVYKRQALFSKVIEGDAEGARQCMEEHMEDVRYNLKSTMGTDHPGQKAAIG